jgi:phosphatidylinositol alpha-1,6-mannosyltransferase
LSSKPVPRETGGRLCLALVTDAFGGHGGIAQYNRDFLTALAACREISSVEVLPRHAMAQILLPDAIRQLPPHPGRFRYAIFAVIAACRRPPDIVFCGHLHIAPLAAAIARFSGARFLVQAHGIEAWSTPSLPIRAAVEAADRVLCVSRHTRAAVVGWADMPPERVVVTPNTVADDFRPGDGSALRETWGLDGKEILLTVGRLDAQERYKGHDRVMRTIPRLLAAGHDVAYVVIGGGEDRRRLEGLAHGLGISDRVHFKGVVSREVLVDAYRMADLYVMPSTGEGFGISFLEAMASGTPALGLAVAGARDALGDGMPGVAVAEDELSAAILDLLDARRPEVETLSRDVRSRFDRELFQRRVGEHVLALLARCPSAGKRNEDCEFLS